MYRQYSEAIENKINAIRYSGGTATVQEGGDTYVILALGERRTGGYDIEIIGTETIMTQAGQSILLKAKEITPGPHDFVTQAITYPVKVYKLPQTQLPVQVEWTRGSSW